MRNQGQLMLSIAIILIGLMMLIGALLGLNIGIMCWPTGLILLGLLLLLRPWMTSPETELDVRPLGPIRRDGPWQATELETWLFVGDLELYLGEAEIPEGVTLIRAFGLVGTIKVQVPDDVGVDIHSTAMVTDAKFLGQKREGIFRLTRLTSENYEAARRKVRLELLYFVADVRVKRI